MDLVSLAFTFLMQHPDVAVSSAQKLARPGVVDLDKMKGSFADFSREALHCYHRTARYQFADVLQKPWSRQGQYGADNSAVIRVRYFGVTGTQYEIILGVLARGNQVRTAVLQDTATIPYSKKCELEEWRG